MTEVVIIVRHSQDTGLLSHSFGISRVGKSITTENGFTHQVSVPTAGGSSHTFDIPKYQAKSVRVCVNSDLFADNCHTYETTGSDMSVSLSAILSHSIKHHLNLFKIF